MHNGSHDFALGSRQASVRRRFALTPREGLQDSAHCGAIKPWLTGVHASDGFQDHLGRLGFVNDASRARKNGAFLGGGVTKAGEDEYRRLARQLRHKIKPTFAAKVQIEQHDVRPVLLHGR